VADLTHHALDGLDAHAKKHGIIVLRGEDALDVLSLARRGLPPRDDRKAPAPSANVDGSLTVHLGPAGRVEMVADVASPSAVIQAELSKLAAVVADSAVEMNARGLPVIACPPCHLPLVALDAWEPCPQCRNPASKHRNWKEKQR
jgi:hypothetical protein